MKKTAKRILGLLAVCAVLGLAACAFYWFTFYKGNVRAQEKQPEIKIYRSSSYDEVLAALREGGVLENEASFLRAAKAMGLSGKFKPGLYVFKPGMGNKAIVRALAMGWQTPVNLVIPGYLRSLERFSAVLGEKLEADSTSFAAALLDEGVMSRYGFDSRTFIGMFIPNTYQVWWTATPEEIVERLNKEYESFWTEERKAKAESIGLTRQEVSTLASIVIEETKYEPEMPAVAGVYMNRLNIGMPLQADPTVIFATGETGIRRVLKRHLEVDSPYNTYKYSGLPPGPITMPPVAALDAVLNYTRHNYLYFCAKPTFDGQHSFATSLSGHMENARAYQKALSAKEKGNPLSSSK